MIVNGESVTDGELPFQVLVTAQWTDHGGSWTSTCGRSLIAPQWVLTAAHCLVRDGGAFAPGGLVVGFGSVYRSKLRRIRVDKAFVHDGSIRCRRTTSVCKLKKPIPDAKTVEFASRTKEGLLRGSDQSRPP
jgi:secreted trypsin-like serine protease